MSNTAGAVFSQDEFLVLINDDLQYSLWPAALEIPEGWQPTGPRGDRSVCLAYVEANWRDMRPRRLREAMDGP